MTVATTPATAEPTPAAERAEAVSEEADAALVDEELLVEDVSIDGMCGVY
ncbi:MAG: mycofactocin precursor MftA [Acidimicrobiales bacterium]